jgi:hypothetical protein
MDHTSDEALKGLLKTHPSPEPSKELLTSTLSRLMAEPVSHARVSATAIPYPVALWRRHAFTLLLLVAVALWWGGRQPVSMTDDELLRIDMLASSSLLTL